MAGMPNPFSWTCSGKYGWEEYNMYEGPPDEMEGSGYTSPVMSEQTFGYYGTAMNVSMRFGEAWHGFTQNSGTVFGAEWASWQISRTYGGATNDLEFRSRICQQSNGSSLWLGVAYKDTNTAYLRFYEEYEYEFTELDAGTSDVTAFGSWYNNIFSSYRGDGSWLTIIMDGASGGTVEFQYVSATYNPGDRFGNDGYAYWELKPAFLGTTDQDSGLYLSTPPSLSSRNNLSKYNIAGRRLLYIGSLTTYATVGTAAQSGTLVGWIAPSQTLGGIFPSARDPLKIGECTYFGINPVEGGGFASETSVVLPELTYFKVFGGLGEVRVGEGTFVIMDTPNTDMDINDIPDMGYFRRMFCGKPKFTEIKYDFFNKTVDVPLTSILSEYSEKAFEIEAANTLIPGLLMGTINSITSGTYSIHAGGNALHHKVYDRAYLHGNLARTGPVSRIGSILDRYFQGGGAPDDWGTTITKILVDNTCPWMMIGNQLWMTTPWPKPARLSQYANQPDFFLKQLLDYMGIPYDTTSTQWSYWLKSVRQMGVYGSPRYYGGEKCLTLLNDLMTALNSTYTISPDGFFCPSTYFVEANAGTTVDISESYPEDFNIYFSEAYRGATFGYEWEPNTQKFLGSFTFETRGSGGKIYNASSPWSGNIAQAAANAARAIKNDELARPVAHFVVEKTRYDDFMPGDIVTIDGMGSILPQYWAGANGSSLMNFTSGRVLYKTFIPLTGQTDVYIIREPINQWVYWGSSIIENGSRWWY